MKPVMIKEPKHAMTLAIIPDKECQAEGTMVMQTERLMGSAGRKRKRRYKQDPCGLLLLPRRDHLLQNREVAMPIHRYGRQMCRPYFLNQLKTDSSSYNIMAIDTDIVNRSTIG